ncbi:MAG: phenylalanine--tRNA ligase subunit alpha [Deltaproteobacteria bacterium]|nr:phenylalanine--tRNA ligase subunit alpha [Deltaproteobacteria bacterium]
MSDAVQEFEAGLARLGGDVTATFAACIDENALRAENAKLAGPQGELTALLKLMPKLPGDRRKELGQRANQVKQAIQSAFDGRLAAIARAIREAELSGPQLDVSLPGRSVRPGGQHPITKTIEELLDVFASLGFEISESREIELAEYNFGRLGFPPDHPATDMQDSFFVKGRTGSAAGGGGDDAVVLRTHATAIQVHEMLARKPPMAVVASGTVYRRDDDATHSPMFHQIDGFLVDKNVSFAHLKGVLTTFLKRTFGADVPVRFRPSYFPFVEPGGELDIGCTFCRPWVEAGSEAQIARTLACRTCKQTGWIEVLGCGSIHPVVFESCGVDPNEWSGFAWGMGIDRIAMLRHGIRDIRMLYENDIRFLDQL